MLVRDFEKYFDAVLTDFATVTSTSLAAALGGIAAIGLTIYFMFMAFAIARGEIQEPMSKLTKDILGMVLIAVIATSVGVYQQYIMGGVYAVLELLTSAVTQSTAKSVGEAIDLLFTMTSRTGDGQELPTLGALWVQAQKDGNAFGIPNLSYLISAVLVWISAVLLSVCVLLPSMLSKVGLNLMLAIGPLFIMLAIIPYTRNYFASWLSSMLGNLITLVLVACISGASLNMFQATLENALKDLSYDTSPIPVALAIIVVAVALGLASLHVSQMGAQLAGGGIALDTKGLAGTVIQSIASRKGQSGAGDGGQASGSSNEMSSGGYDAGKRLGQIISGLGRKSSS